MRRKQVFPIACILLYILFTITDTYTTYLATPDLKYEANPLYLYFKWGWSTQLIYISFMVLMTVLFAIWSNGYVINYFKRHKGNSRKYRFLFIVSFLLLTYCYNNLFSTFECTINNYLNYRYLIMGRMIVEGESRFILGVPGVYENQERVMANMFGFSNFKPANLTEIKSGEFGYWYRTVR